MGFSQDPPWFLQGQPDLLRLRRADCDAGPQVRVAEWHRGKLLPAKNNQELTVRPMQKMNILLADGHTTSHAPDLF